MKHKWVSRNSYSAVWRPIFQGWSKFTNLECNYWFCFVYKQIWWTFYLLWIHGIFSFYSWLYGYNFTAFKILIFTFSYYFFCIPGTHNNHGAKCLLFFCLLCTCLVLSPRACSFRMYKHACFDVLKKSRRMINSPFVNKLSSSFIILRPALSLGYQTNIALACLLTFSGEAE